MRLIDADLVIDTVNEFKGKNRITDLGIKLVKEIVSNAPTVDIERHGHWKRTSGSYVEWYECSECGSKASVFWGVNSLTDYCPHCGAKMDASGEK